MTGVSEWERWCRYRYVEEALVQVVDYRISQVTLAEIASRHVYTPVTVGWVQNHWGIITRMIHMDHPNMWVFRPQWSWDYLVGATTHLNYAKVAAFERYRQIRSRVENDLFDGNLRGMAQVDPEMAGLVQRYEAFLDKADDMEKEYQALLAGLYTLPVATEAMTHSL